MLRDNRINISVPVRYRYCIKQCCGSETFHYGSGSDFSMSFGSGSYSQKNPVLDPAFFLTKYDFKGPKMAFQNIIFKEYLNLVHKNGQNY
jgi:hypothetical protein